MRKMLLLAALVAVSLTFIDQKTISDGTHKVFDGISLPLGLVRLYAKEPDQQLMIPIKGVGVKQIKDTWHAPRAGDRLRERSSVMSARRETHVALPRTFTSAFTHRQGQLTLCRFLRTDSEFTECPSQALAG